MQAEDNHFPYITITETVEPANPDTGDQRLYIDPADHKLKRTNSGGTVTVIEGGTIGGATGSTDNAIIRADGTGGATIQSSLATVGDGGGINIPTGQTYDINGSPHSHAAISFVGAKYSTNTAQAVTSAATIINFEDSAYDPGVIVTTGASWHVTIPSTGYYQINVMITLDSASWAVANDITVYVYVGGASVGAIASLSGISGTIYARVAGSDTFSFTASDSVDIRVTQSAQASINTYNNGSFNHVAITKVG